MYYKKDGIKTEDQMFQQKCAEVEKQLELIYGDISKRAPSQTGRTLLEGISIDTPDARFIEDGFAFKTITRKDNIVSDGRLLSNHFMVFVVFQDNSELFKIKEFKDELVNNQRIAISGEAKKKYFSFDEGQIREANALSFLIHRDYSPESNDPPFLRVDFRSIYFKNAKRFTFDEYSQLIEKNRDVKDLCKAIDAVTQKCMKVNHGNYSSPSGEMLKNALLLSRHATAKIAKEYKIPNFIYAADSENGEQELSFKPGYNSYYKVDPFSESLKSLTNIIGALNNETMLAKAQRRPQNLTAEEYSTVLVKTNAAIKEFNGDKAKTSNFLTGDPKRQNSKWATFPRVDVRETYDMAKTSAVRLASINKSLEQLFDNNRNGGSELKKEDIYPAILANSEATEFIRDKIAVKEILINNGKLALQVFDNLIYDNPGRFDSFTKKSILKGKDNGELDIEHRFELYTKSRFRIFANRGSGDLEDAARNLLSALSFRTASYVDLKQSGVIVNAASDRSKNEGVSGIILSSPTITKKYSELDKKMEKLEAVFEGNSREKILGLAREYGWEVIETYSEKNKNPDGAKWKILIKADIFGSKKEFFGYAKKDQHQKLQGELYDKAFELVKSCAQTINSEIQTKGRCL